jgi:hypothetical protein
MSANGRNRPRLRFGLRSLFWAIAVVALLVWGGGKFYNWYFSVPLGDAVAAFNTRAESDPVGKLEPRLTEDEIVVAIQSQLPTLKAGRQVKDIYQRIARTRRLPHAASLTSIPGCTTESGQSYTVWWINLEVMTSKTTGYGLRIRETNDPVAAAGAAPYVKKKH